MKHLFRFFFLTFVMIYGIKPSIAQWVQTGGPNKGQVNSLYVSGDTLIAGYTNGGIATSADGGNTWSETYGGYGKVNKFLPVEGEIWAHLYTVNYIAGWSREKRGFIRSTNNGVSWSTWIDSLAVQTDVIVSYGTVLYAGGNGVQRSTDAGITWISVNNGLPLDAWGKVIGVTGLFHRGESSIAGTDVGLYRTTNGGTTWDSRRAKVCKTIHSAR